MKKELLTVKELAAELRMSLKSIQRAYRKGEIPVQWLRSHGAVRSRTSSTGDETQWTKPHAPSQQHSRHRRARPAAQPPARTAEKPPFGKTGAEFPRFFTEDHMSIWTCVLGWFRFTVPDSTADEVMHESVGSGSKIKKVSWATGKAGCPVGLRVD